MKDDLMKIRTMKKLWSLGSLAEDVYYQNTYKKKDSNRLVKKSSKIDYFPIDNLHRVQIQPNLFIISPDSSFNIINEVLLLFCLLIRVYMISYYITFDPEMIPSIGPVILCTDIVFCVDLVLNFSKGYYCKGILVNNRILIIKRYLKTGFLFDFIGSVPFQLAINDSLLEYQNHPLDFDFYRFSLFVKFIHLYRVKSIIYKIEDKITSIHSVTFLKLFTLTIVITLMLHWTTCFVYVFYMQELKNYGDLWNSYIYEKSLAYLHFFYSILYTVTGLGYFAFNIVSVDQKIITLLIMCLDIIIFAYILGKLEATVDGYTEKTKETQRIMKMCKIFISQNNIPNALRHKILNYVSFCRQTFEKSLENEIDLLGGLSLPLREEIFSHTRGFILSQNTIFSTFPLIFLKFIGYYLKVQIFGPRDSIFEEGENGSIVYFIQKGSIEIYHNVTGTIYKILHKGKSFGEISFLLKGTRAASAKSCEFTELLTLSREVFNKILLSRPFEKRIVDGLIFNTQREGIIVLRIKCYYCKKIGHLASTCKDYRIPLEMEKITQKVNHARFRFSKIVNFNDSFKFTFKRSEQKPVKNRFSLINTQGSPINPRKTFRSKPSLVKRILGFRLPNLITNKKQIISMINEEESLSDSENIESPLPKAMRYRLAFLERSKKRKNSKGTSANSIQLFNSEGFPDIYVTTPA